MTGTSAGTLEETQPASALEVSEEVQSHAAVGVASVNAAAVSASASAANANVGATGADAGAASASAGAASTSAGAAIKECPVCKTTLFGDMDTCYGCMYRFGSSPNLEAPPAESPSAQVDALGMVSAKDDYLFNKFLVEFHSFLGDFIANRKIDVD